MTKYALPELRVKIKYYYCIYAERIKCKQNNIPHIVKTHYVDRHGGRQRDVATTEITFVPALLHSVEDERQTRAEKVLP